MMHGISTADASPTTLCYPGLRDEDPATAQDKCYRDSRVLLLAANEVIATGGTFGAVSMSSFNEDIGPHSLKSISVISDASLTGCSILCRELRQLINFYISPKSIRRLRRVTILRLSFLRDQVATGLSTWVAL